MHFLIYLSVHSLILWLIGWFIHPFIHCFIEALIHSFICAFIKVFIYLNAKNVFLLSLVRELSHSFKSFIILCDAALLSQLNNINIVHHGFYVKKHFCVHNFCKQSKKRPKIKKTIDRWGFFRSIKVNIL